MNVPLILPKKVVSILSPHNAHLAIVDKKEIELYKSIFNVYNRNT